MQANQNTNIFQGKVTRTIKYKNTFFPNAVCSWNNIITNFRGNHTKSGIKAHILKFIRPNPKSIYNIHDPVGLHYLFQLRTGLSSLRSHKYRHNFRDTPNANCNCQQGIEDTKHFLFECLQFANDRVRLGVKITNILLKNLAQLASNVDLYIYGDDSLTLDDNKEVLVSTIQYIKNTGRFQS